MLVNVSASGYGGSAAHVCSVTTPAAKNARNRVTGERIGGRTARNALSGSR
jgi:hypothetical protein